MTLMWDKVIMVLGLGFSVGDMASKDEIAEVEETLSATFPRSLRGFLMEMNGTAINLNGLEPPDDDSHLIKLVWSCEEIIEQNQALRVRDAAPDRTMTYGDLLWFGCRPKGGLVGFQVMDGKAAESTVFVVDPRQPSEPRPQAASLREYLVDILAEYQREHPESAFDFL